MKKTVKIVIPVVLVLALLVILAGSLVVTQPDEYTIIKQFGAVVKIIDQPGLRLTAARFRCGAKMEMSLKLPNAVWKPKLLICRSNCRLRH